MEIDAGAARTVMSSNQHQQLFPGEKLRDSAVVLRTYSTEQLAVTGEMTVDVMYGAQQAKLKLLVVEGDGPCLLGLDWLSQIRLDWKGLAQSSLNWQGAPSVALQSLLMRYKDVFRPELGTVKNVKVSLSMKADAKPKFCRPHSVPFAMKKSVEKEIDRLEAKRILEKVEYSEWAALIVSVPKKKMASCGYMRGLQGRSP
jgi:hypothetical protein